MSFEAFSIFKFQDGKEKLFYEHQFVSMFWKQFALINTFFPTSVFVLNLTSLYNS